jgi:hypothetical protein
LSVATHDVYSFTGLYAFVGPYGSVRNHPDASVIELMLERAVATFGRSR